LIRTNTTKLRTVGYSTKLDLEPISYFGTYSGLVWHVPVYV